jgi:hypothetical protein
VEQREGAAWRRRHGCQEERAESNRHQGRRRAKRAHGHSPSAAARRQGSQSRIAARGRGPLLHAAAVPAHRAAMRAGPCCRAGGSCCPSRPLRLCSAWLGARRRLARAQRPSHGPSARSSPQPMRTPPLSARRPRFGSLGNPRAQAAVRLPSAPPSQPHQPWTARTPSKERAERSWRCLLTLELAVAHLPGQLAVRRSLEREFSQALHPSAPATRADVTANATPLRLQPAAQCARGGDASWRSRRREKERGGTRTGMLLAVEPEPEPCCFWCSFRVRQPPDGTERLGSDWT